MKRSGEWSRFLSDDQAQATIEYLLILSIVVGIGAMVLKTLAPLLKRMSENLSKTMTQSLFNPSGMHSFPVRR